MPERAGRPAPRRPWTVASAGAAIAALVVPSFMPPLPRLVWNASASVPPGLYAVSPATPERGDMVAARLPSAARVLAAKRGYLPPGVPLVKRVAAIAGERVCAGSERISVGAGKTVQRLHADSKGRTMPRWSGCVTLAPGMVLLLGDDPASFDGRYFGPTRASDIIGKADLIWAR